MQSLLLNTRMHQKRIKLEIKMINLEKDDNEINGGIMKCDNIIFKKEKTSVGRLPKIISQKNTEDS